MHRLSGEDAGFLAMELPEQAMNTMAVGTLSTDGGPSTVTLAQVRTHIAGRLDQLPSFRWRIVAVPFGLHSPVCVRDPDFDLNFHLREATLSTGQALDELFASLAERHLDRRHPLWQLTLVHGCEGGSQALILKYHHALADGVAAFTTFSRVYSDAPADPIPDVVLPWTAEKIPGSLALVAMAVIDHLRALVRLPALAWRTKRALAAVKARRARTSVVVPDFNGAAPNCELNDAFTAGRAYARAEISLSQARALKDAAGVTLNDVVLATVAGGLRGYLSERGELPDLPLLASVPVSYEPPDAPLRQAGNRFWSFTTSLATDIVDPAQRLATISQVAAEAKAQLAELGEDLLPTWLDLVPPFVSEPGARALVARLRDGGDLVDSNIVISNIRGPAEPWTLIGTTVTDLFIDGPPSNGVGCNVMLWSYGDRLLFGVLAFADALRDPPALTRHLTTAFEDLRHSFRL